MESTTGVTPQNPTHLIAEIDPPKGVNLDAFLKTALHIRGRVDGVRVTDSEHAIMRMSPIAPCMALQEKKIDMTQAKATSPLSRPVGILIFCPW